MAKLRSEAGEQDLVRLYLDGIGRYPLLSKDDEVELSQALEEGRLAAEELARDRVSPAKARELRRIARRGAEASELFVNCNLRLVVSIAKKYQSVDMPLLDLIQEGNFGLMHAVEKFDWRKGFKFSTYATWWIRQSIGRGIDNTSRTIRLPVHAGDQIRRLLRTRSQMEGELGRVPSVAELADVIQLPEPLVADLLQYGVEPVSLESAIGDGDTELADMVSDPTAPMPFEIVAGKMLSSEVDKLLASLDDRERQILSLRYGLDRGDPRTLEEVGTALNLTRERIRQIERAALSKLRHPSVESGARDLLAS
ncbi:MAG: sigma-70 family RNA polymerase sigma factor [Acidimicrobiales bacterium]